MKRIYTFLLNAFLLHVCVAGYGQTNLCPPNFDFEHGNFNNWLCQQGTVESDGTVNLLPGPAINGIHTIIPAATAGLDKHGLFPRRCPNGSGFSVQLGNEGAGGKAESISYTYTIPATVNTFSILFNYAVVLQNPSHEEFEQPRFRARIIDLSTNQILPCVDFDFAASSSLPGFKRSTVQGDVYYKDWTPVTINLEKYIGKTIKLEFITNDCTYTAHFGYAYVDVNSGCNGAIVGANICAGDNDMTMTAPNGFKSYKWYTDNTFTTVLDTTQSLYLNPAPAIGTVFPLIVIPYPGFGCIDTLYATIKTAPKPISHAGNDADICKYQKVQLGAARNPLYTYLWKPVAQVSDTLISNPLGWTISNNPVQFIVRTTEILTGCFSYDTVSLRTKVVDTAIKVTGPTNYCEGESKQTVLSLNRNSTIVQWFDKTIALLGVTMINYHPIADGQFWAEVTQNGCKDSTAKITIVTHPLPVTKFNVNNDTACITNNSFTFTNTTTPAERSLWKFSDGSTLNSTDASKSFNTPGNFTASLVTTTAFGCKDSSDIKLVVTPNVVADFNWDSVCVNRPVLFYNKGIENNSVLVKYKWEFNNGGPVITDKNPPLITYTSGGKTNVLLTMTAIGCENYEQVKVKPVQVNIPASNVRYKTVTTAQGYTGNLQARDKIGTVYKWRPQLQLSSYNTRTTQFFATNNDIDFRIDITDKHTCVTTDTLSALILKKPGYYLPTGFTPNNDGLNDIIQPFLVNMKELKSFSIFNRWGQLVFHTTRNNTGWDGKMKGKDQPPAVYVWTLEFIDMDNKVVSAKGTLTLIR